MKKNINRMLSLVLAVLCFLCFTGVNAFAENSGAGDIIILAGKGHETYQILNTGTIHLDEREIVNEALDAL